MLITRSATLPAMGEDGRFVVVMNDEEQYSILLTDEIVPDGWHLCAVTGPKKECLEWIDAHWTDPRPKSVRARLERSQP